MRARSGKDRGYPVRRTGPTWIATADRLATAAVSGCTKNHARTPTGLIQAREPACGDPRSSSCPGEVGIAVGAGGGTESAWLRATMPRQCHGRRNARHPTPDTRHPTPDTRHPAPRRGRTAEYVCIAEFSPGFHRHGTLGDGRSRSASCRSGAGQPLCGQNPCAVKNPRTARTMTDTATRNP